MARFNSVLTVDLGFSHLILLLAMISPSSMAGWLHQHTTPASATLVVPEKSRKGSEFNRILSDISCLKVSLSISGPPWPPSRLHLSSQLRFKSGGTAFERLLSARIESVSPSKSFEHQGQLIRIVPQDCLRHGLSCDPQIMFRIWHDYGGIVQGRAVQMWQILSR